jgi:hypothetical protein
MKNMKLMKKRTHWGFFMCFMPFMVNDCWSANR